jgi:MFS superfamily sulfate permease-like transporter
MQSQWLLAILSILIVIACRKSRHVPAALILLFLAAIIIWLNNDTPLAMQPAFRLPSVAHIDLERILEAMLQAGFAQIPLTAANAVIATAALARSYWPDSPITEKKLSLSIGLINMAAPLTGGIPVCHGAGGLAAQYAFGARTCGTKIIEGSIMLALGLLLAGNIADLLTAFPEAVLGVMLLVPAFELLKPATALRSRTDLALLAVTVLSALLVNMALGFLLGITWYYAQKRLTKLNLEKKP